MRKDVSTQDLVVWMNEEKLPITEIESKTGMSRQGIWKRLRRAGAFIKRSAPGGAPGKRVTRDCFFCGKPVTRYTKRLIRENQINVFCSQDCYSASLEQHPYEEWRQGSRLARAIVAQHFPLLPVYIVHHKDGNQRNNNLANLSVFENQADHIAHHRGRTVIPLFDGSTIAMEKC